MATKAIGARPGQWNVVLLALAIVLKLALMVAGVAWLAHQPWIDKRAMLIGLLAPFAMFVLWQVLSLQLRAGRRA